MSETTLFYKLKRELEGLSPQNYDLVRRGFHKRLLYRMLRKITGQDGLVVQAGPFRGMRYLPELMSRRSLEKYALFPKILGSYEEELHPMLMRMFSKGYDQVVNIGCAEGYYSVGVLRQLPGAHTYAFDSDADAKRFCQQMAHLNGVADRLTVKDDSAISELGTLAKERTLVICDCNGDTLDLLRPDLVPGLGHCDLIVELGDKAGSSLHRIISERFAPTHEMTTLVSRERERDLSSYPSLDPFSLYKRQLAIEEWRTGFPIWTVMTTKDGYRSA
jgi:hypothetical protein